MEWPTEWPAEWHAEWPEELMPAGKGWPGMHDPRYIRWEPWRVRQLAESHAHNRKAEVSYSLTEFS